MEINTYGKQLSDEEIETLKHRSFIGGMWEEIGALQFTFLKDHGLTPQDRLLDLGCGALRGGLHFIEYLDPGHYCGLDINASLIKAGTYELQQKKLEHKEPKLMVSEHFDIGKFGLSFDCAIAISLFTHLPMNHIIVALAKVGACLKPEAAFYASFFLAPRTACFEPLLHSAEKIETFYDQDPYHYAYEEISWMAAQAGLEATLIGEWEHPRGQQMLKFTLPLSS